MLHPLPLARRKLLLSFLDDDDYPIPIDKKSCALLGPTALVVQALMGVLVVLSLVYKRYREPNKRPWRIWTYDVSKQIVGQAFVHSTNVLISSVGADVGKQGKNACIYYFFNILIDTTLGVAIIYGFLRLARHLFVVRLQLKGFESGLYGTPPRLSYWARQAAVYVAAITTMKLIVIGIFAAFPGIINIGEWLLSWIGNNPNLQVIFVMGFFPIIMNIIQFWVIDSIVKAGNGSTPEESGSSEEEADAEARAPLFTHDDEEEQRRPSIAEDLQPNPKSPPMEEPKSSASTASSSRVES